MVHHPPTRTATLDPIGKRNWVFARITAILNIYLVYPFKALLVFLDIDGPSIN